jgi:exopolysaccharide biosynthesis polyprenyl glycosylphosphotransferase
MTSKLYPTTDQLPMTPGEDDCPRQVPSGSHGIEASGSAKRARLADRSGLPAVRLRLPGLSLRTSERKVILATVDYLLLATALVISVRWLTTLLDAPGALRAYWYWFATLLLLWWLMAQLTECYDLARAASAPYSILSTVGAAGLTVLVYQFIPVLTPPLISRMPIVVFALLALGSLALWRGLYAIAFVQPTFHERALVLGAGASGRDLACALGQVRGDGNPYRGTGYHLVGFVDDDPAKRAPGEWAALPVLGGSGDLLRLSQEHKIDEVVVAVTGRHSLSPAALDALLICREQGMRVTTMPTLYERLLGRIPVAHVGHNLAAVLPMEEGASARLYGWIKRITDVVVSAIGLALLAPVMAGVAVANLLFAPGPLFYRQARAGRGGRIFTVTKFRTMRPDAENGTGAIWASQDDPRVTVVGRWLRRSRLDELPQLINVLRGEMSLVGPRPERPEFMDALVAQIPFYRARHAVPPGLTGWAQVRFGYGSSVDEARTKLEYDLYYVRHAGFYLDALIVLKTLAVVLGLKGK